MLDGCTFPWWEKVQKSHQSSAETNVRVLNHLMWGQVGQRSPVAGFLSFWRDNPYQHFKYWIACDLLCPLRFQRSPLVTTIPTVEGRSGFQTPLRHLTLANEVVYRSEWSENPLVYPLSQKGFDCVISTGTQTLCLIFLCLFRQTYPLRIWGLNWHRFDTANPSEVYFT